MKGVFASPSSTSRSTFSDTEISRDRDSVVYLLGFAKSLANSKDHSIENIFRFLDVYEKVSELRPEIDSIFDIGGGSPAAMTLSKLGKAVKAMLTKFEKAIEKDSTKPLPCGGVHPLTRYVMDHLVSLSDYFGGAAASEIVAGWQLSMQLPLPEEFFSNPHRHHGGASAAVSDRFALLVLLLICQLNAKADMYKKDVELTCLFLAKNLNYVISKVRESNLSTILGSGWISMHEGRVKQYGAYYEMKGWENVLSSPPGNSTADICPKWGKRMNFTKYLGPK